MDDDRGRKDRRQVLKAFILGGAATTVVLPAAWHSPLVRSVIVPAHAQASPRDVEEDDKYGKDDKDHEDDKHHRRRKKRTTTTTPEPNTTCELNFPPPYGECRTPEGQCGCNGANNTCVPGIDACGG